MPYECPHCGNRNYALMQDNGVSARHPDFTLLCVAPCGPDETSFTDPIEPEDGQYVCGMQWSPNQEDDHDEE